MRTINGQIYYYINGEAQIGWQLIDECWYYFYENEPYNGDMAVNTVIDDYQLDEEGRIVA